MDIGSGYGRLLDYLKELGFKYVFGLESDFRFLEQGPTSIVCGRGEQTPFKEKSFGGIFSIGILSYIIEDQNRARFLNEIHRILKSQGFLFMSCFLISGDEYHQKKYREGQSEHGIFGIFESDSGGIFRHSQENELKELLANFHILRWKTRPFTTMNGREALGVMIEARKQRRENT